MKYIPQVDDVIVIINSDKTIKGYKVSSVSDDDNCRISNDDIFVVICRNEVNDLIYNVIALDVVYNVYDIKRNNELIVNNHDIFVYVKES